MERVKPLLDEIELQNVQKLEIEDDQVLLAHEIPALEGDFFQREDRRASLIRLNGIMNGSDVTEKLRELREKFRNAVPVSFVSDISVATRIDQVLISELTVREVAGKPERFEYALALREFIEPPPVSSQPDPEPPPNEDDEDDQTDEIVDSVGTLVVEVTVEGEPDFDFSTIVVTAEGTKDDGTDFSLTLTERAGNVWTAEEFPGGQYTVTAVIRED